MKNHHLYILNRLQELVAYSAISSRWISLPKNLKVNLLFMVSDRSEMEQGVTYGKYCVLAVSNLDGHLGDMEVREKVSNGLKSNQLTAVVRDV